jgi:DNA excision repair protein ERCC-3
MALVPAASGPLESVSAKLFKKAGPGELRQVGIGKDYSVALKLREDGGHSSKPMWVCPDHRIILESSSPVYKEACDFLIAIAEPVCRTRFLQEYQLTSYSLYAGASMGLLTEDILTALRRFSKTELPTETVEMVTTCTARYGKVKLVLQKGQFFIECPGQPTVLETLLQDPVLAAARKLPQPDGAASGPAAAGAAAATAAAAAAAAAAGAGRGDAASSAAAAAAAVADQLRADTFRGAAAAALEEDDEPKGDEAALLERFEVDAKQIKEVKARCNELDWPLLEEYDFRNDHASHELPIELKPETKIRDYQERSLSRMFSNHRARSGIIVLPCGAGKTLVGIVAACTIKRSCLVLCNSSVSVEQWYNQFTMWTDIPLERITKFTAGSKEVPHKDACVLVATYNMLTHSGKRADDTKLVLKDLETREWGLLLMDEVHVVPAATFLTCTTKTKSRCKLGLTATLVREDEKIDDLNFLIGPKLYEANWLDLQERGFIAKVQCAEVWCPMTAEFYNEYLRTDAMLQRLLYAMNPNKFRACEYLMRFHEARGDKVIIFSDNVFALKEYAIKLGRPFIYGPTSQNERLRVLEQFKTGTKYNTIFISKVGDTSIDLPDANVIIQISSHFGARRQEAQRLGRILRPKTRPGEVSAFNAFFYTLVSRDTQEVFYSTKRQQFLVDQGYAFKVIPELTDMGDGGGEGGGALCYSSQAEQLELLQKVLTTNLANMQADEDNDAAVVTSSGGSRAAGHSAARRPALLRRHLAGRRPGWCRPGWPRLPTVATARLLPAGNQQGVPSVSRKRGSMSELSGGTAHVYSEGPRGAAAKGVQHSLFRKQANDRAKQQKEARREAGD